MWPHQGIPLCGFGPKTGPLTRPQLPQLAHSDDRLTVWGVGGWADQREKGPTDVRETRAAMRELLSCRFVTERTKERTMSLVEADKKRVRWGGVKVLEFRVGYSSCAVPPSGGPPIGLVGNPIDFTYEMLPAINLDDDEDSDEDMSSGESDSENNSEQGPLGSLKRTRSELWMCPMERVKILQEESSFKLDEITLICSEVRAVLDSRAYSRVDSIAEQMMCAVEASRPQTFQTNRKKVVLF